MDNEASGLPSGQGQAERDGYDGGARGHAPSAQCGLSRWFLLWQQAADRAGYLPSGAVALLT